MAAATAIHVILLLYSDPSNAPPASSYSTSPRHEAHPTNLRIREPAHEASHRTLTSEPQSLNARMSLSQVTGQRLEDGTRGHRRSDFRGSRRLARRLHLNILGEGSNLNYFVTGP